MQRGERISSYRCLWCMHGVSFQKENNDDEPQLAGFNVPLRLVHHIYHHVISQCIVRGLNLLKKFL